MSPDTYLIAGYSCLAMALTVLALEKDLPKWIPRLILVAILGLGAAMFVCYKVEVSRARDYNQKLDTTANKIRQLANDAGDILAGMDNAKSDEDEKRVRNMKEKWQERVVEYLSTLGPDYVMRFRCFDIPMTLRSDSVRPSLVADDWITSERVKMLGIMEKEFLDRKIR